MNQHLKPLLVSSGEPAGVGPDLCLALAGTNLPIVVMGDKEMLKERADLLKQNVTLVDYKKDKPIIQTPHHLTILPLTCPAPVIAGTLDPKNGVYVLDMLEKAATYCLHKEFSAVITAPVHKAVLNQAGFDFTGHTEFFAQRCQAPQVVMMLVCDAMKVALLTTHLPLNQVAEAVSISLVIEVITQLHTSLQTDFNIVHPLIYVSGLNPHAGEAGYLGREEIEIIQPALDILRSKGIRVQGPMPADTMFTPQNAKTCDAFVAMYHDQGLPVLKYAGFGTAVNVTLGLPIIRTSVDHGTALELAGTGKAHTGSIRAAVNLAAQIVTARTS